ncbi:MAG: tryptophan synthase subunit alpha [Deltaproteobacteria bacterium]|nr:tryptophan synthase subunit alpha [Deltaproteobacteria bacterium]MBW2019808.1 tryptophan synthase subunit alpha [Deltaproteobacteria bacterium]MBW2074613.1 tryptophan synthase subunit alpha [Deltaproteobacteria bacterium]
MLEEYIRQRTKERGILLMAHVVVGYPDLETTFELVKTIVSAGVDLMELQIPFSEPIADGPVILKANQSALAAGTRVDDCFRFAHRVTQTFEIPFLFMTYYNIVFKRGEERFFAEAKEVGIRGAIVPDIPPGEGESYMAAAVSQGVDPIFILSPTTTPDRLAYLAGFGRGFFYCVARKGITGAKTRFSSELEEFLGRCRGVTQLPLALGFGVSEKKDVDFLKGKVEVAVVGSQALRVLNASGVEAVGVFFRGLR